MKTMGTPAALSTARRKETEYRRQETADGIQETGRRNPPD
jgi:hypothetical protein